MPVAGAVIGGVAAIGGAVLSSKAQKKAANKATEAQTESAAQQLALQKEIYAQNTANAMPYINSGYGAQSVVMQLLGLKPMTAGQFNNGDWYTPGTVNYNNQASTSGGTGGTSGGANPNYASQNSAWTEAALNNIMPHIGPQRTAAALRISDPAARLNYLQGVFHDDEKGIYNSWLSSNPQPTQYNYSSSAGGSGGATGFQAQPAGTPPAPTAPAAPSNATSAQLNAWAQEAIANGAPAAQVNARLQTMLANQAAQPAPATPAPAPTTPITPTMPTAPTTPTAPSYGGSYGGGYGGGSIIGRFNGGRLNLQ